MKQKLLSILTSIMMVFTICLAGCSPTPLDTPSGLQSTGDKLIWNYVDSATGYILNVNGVEYKTGENYYSFANMSGLNDGQSYTAMVKSKGDGYLKLNSEYGPSITFTYNAPSNNNAGNSGTGGNGSGEKTEITEDVKDSIINNTASTYYGIGRSFNATAASADLDNISASILSNKMIFDTNKLANKNWFTTNYGKMAAKSYSKTSMEELFNSVSESYNVAAGGSMSYGAFTAGLETSFSTAKNSSFKNTNNEVFCTFSQVYGAKLVAIESYGVLSEFVDALSNEFLTDASNINSKASAQNFINKYGTHVILAGYYGGKINYTYYLRNTESKWTESEQNDFAMQVNAAVQGLGSVHTSTGFQIKNELGLSSSLTTEEFTANTIGGNLLEANSLSAFLANYSSWTNFMNTSSTNDVIVDFPERGIACIWDLLPSSYTNAKTYLQDYFDDFCSANLNSFLSKYTRESINAPTAVNTIHYNTLSCKMDNGYNYTDPLTETGAEWKHDHFSLGEFTVTNANVSNNNTLSLIPGYDTTISFKVQNNCKQLPTAGRCTSAAIQNDGTYMSFYNLPFNIGSQRVGYGLIVATVTYNDGSSQYRVTINNAFKDKTIGDTITIIDSAYLNKDCVVNIAILYEIQHWAPGFLGISDDYHTNWRINQTFTVNY